MTKEFTLLYIDDEEVNLRLFKNLFRREYNVFTAISAKDGMEIFDKEEVDMVLSDQRMPDVTGVEFLQSVYEKSPHTIRFLVTGYTDFTALKEGINGAKINKYIQKPWSDKVLRSTIQDVLAHYNLEKLNRALTKQLASKNIELETTNAELVIAHKKSEESDRLKSAFLSNISHEIRTPLNGIVGFSEILTESVVDNDDMKMYKDILSTCSNQLLSIVTDIIDISRIEAEEISFSQEKILLNDKLLEVITELENESNEKGLEIIQQFPLDDSYTIHTDHDKFLRIVKNLLHNAISFTNQGQVKISYELEDSILKITFKDTGIGIPEDIREKIFNSFYQQDVSNTRAMGGLGLGLSIVKSYVKAIGGDIGVESVHGEGSVFWFTCPINISAKSEE